MKRSGPRCIVGTPRWRRPRGSRPETRFRDRSRLDGTFHDAADDLAAEEQEHDAAAGPCRRRSPRRPASSRCSRRTRGTPATPAAVGLSGREDSVRPEERFQVLHERQQAEHGGRRAQRGQHHVPVDPERAAAVDPGRLDQLVGDRLGGVLPHHEHAEGADQERHGDRAAACRTSRSPGHHAPERDEAELGRAPSW